MKNFSKTITAVSLSLLTVGAMAQIPFSGAPNQRQGHPKVGPSMNRHHATKASSGGQSFQLFYVGSDANLVSSYSTSLGYFTDQINGRFTDADTNVSTVPRQNFNLVTSAAVAFDTMMDGALNAYNMSAVYVDTLWLVCAYKNTSGMNDTLVFTVNAVGATGLPTATVYSTTKVPIYPGVTFATNTGNLTLPGTGLDSLYEAIAIPATALPAGVIHFAANVTFLGSKADTFQLGYGFPLSTCSSSCGSYDYANPSTAVGDLYTDTKTIPVNSYAWMFQEYFGTTTMQPSANGTILQFYMANNYEWNVCPGSCTTDTMFFYEQDYAIAASVSDFPTGIQNVTSNGLSVGQNYPNPFNKTTQINYSLTKSSDVTFSVYDMTGRVLVNNVYTNSAPGTHTINLSANSFSPGVYFYTFNVNGNKVTNKMVITE